METKSRNIKIPVSIVKKWQDTLNFIADFYEVPAAFIIKAKDKCAEVFIASETDENPYRVNQEWRYDTDFFCKHVMAKKEMLYIPDITDDKYWKENTAMDQNIISYMGIPVLYPDDTIFGTLCVMDKKEHKYSGKQKKLLCHYKDLIESDLKNIETESEKNKTENLLVLQRNLSMILNVKVDLDEVLNEILNCVMEIEEIDSSGIYFSDKSTKDLYLVAHKGLSKQFINDVKYYKSDTPQAKMVYKGDLIYLQYEEMDFPVKDPRKKRHIESVAIVPITHENEIIGCLNLASHKYREISRLSRNTIEGIAEIISSLISRAKAEKEKKESEEKLKITLESVSADSWLMNMQEKEMIYSEKWAGYMGYTFDEMPKKFEEIKKFIHPDDVKMNHENFQKHVKGDLPVYESEVRIRKKNGEYMWVFSRGRIVEYDGNGVPVKLIGASFDITERKKAELELIKANEYNKKIAETSPVGIVTLDKEGYITYANKKAENIFGLDKNQITKLTYNDPEWHITDLNGSPFPEEQLPFYLVKNERKTVYDIRHAIKWPDGKKVFISVNASPLFDEKQKFEGMIATIEDITGQKKAQQELFLTKFGIDHSQIGVFQIDNDGNIIYVNHHARNELGYSFQEFHDMKIWDIDPDLNEEKWKTHRKRTRENVNTTIETTHRRKDGSVFPVEVQIDFFNFEGKSYSFSYSKNITERKENEQILIENENKYRTLFENANDAIFLMEKERFADCNPKTLEMYGCTRDEIIGQTPYFFSPEKQPGNRKSKDMVHEYINNALNGKPQFFEWKHKKPDGTLFDAEVSLNTIDISGRKYIQAIVRDITERKKAEEKICRERDKAKQYLDIAGVIFVSINKNGNVTLINNKGCEILGYENDEITGKNWFDLFLPEEIKDSVRTVFNNLMKGKMQSAKYFENPIINKKGEIRIIAWRNSIIKDADGKIAGTLSSGEDITERKQAEEDLGKERDRIIKMASVIPGALNTYKERPDRTHHMPYVSPQIFDITGFTPEQLAEDADFLMDRIYKEDLPGVKVVIKESENKSIPFQCEYRYNHPNKGLIWLEINSVPVKEQDGSIIWHGIINDITERKRVEKALQESEERLRLALESAIADSWDIDFKSRRLLYGDRWAEYMGYSPGEIPYTFQGVRDIIHPDDVQKNYKKLSSYLKGKVPIYESEYRLRKKNGEYIWILSRGKIVSYDINGNPLRLIGTNIDISQYKKIEKELKKQNYEYQALNEEYITQNEELYNTVKKMQQINSELEETKERITESEEKYRILINNQTDLIVKVDTKGRFLFVSPSYCKMFGKTEDQLLGMKFTPLVKKDDKVSTDEIIKDLYMPPYKAYIEQKEKTKNGWKWLAWLNTSILNEKNEVIEIIGVGRDISEKKEAEEQLQLTQFSMDKSMDAIYWMNKDGGLSYVNDQACQSLGYTREELLKLKLWDFDPVYPKEQWNKEWKSYQKDHRGGGQNVETIHRRKDGTDFPVEVTSQHIWFGDTELHVAHVHDISERKIAENKLKESEENYRRLFEHSNDAIFIHDYRGNLNNVNKRACQMTGYSKDKLLHMNVHDLHPKNELKKINNKLLKTIKTGSTRYETSFKKVDNTIIHVEISSKIVDQNKKIIQKVVRDITERKKAEIEMQQAADIFNNIQTGIYIFRLENINNKKDLRMVAANPATEKLTGVKIKDVIGNTLYENFPAYQDNNITQIFANVIRTGKPYEIEEIQYSDNRISESAFSVKTFPLPNQSIGIAFENITEKKKAKEALISSEAEIKSIFRSAPVGVGLIINRHILRVNDKICEMLKYTKDELIGQNARILYPSDEDYHYVGKEKYNQIEKYGTGTVETKWKKKDGETIDIILSSTPIDIHDLSKGVTFSALDITGRKKAELELSNIKSLLESVIEQSPVPIVVISAPDLLVRYVNKACEEQLGIEDEENKIGKHLNEFKRTWKDLYIDGTEMATEDMPIIKAIKGIHTRNTEIMVIRKDGTKRYELVDGVPIYNNEGELIAGVIIFPNITERKLAELALKESEKKFKDLVEQINDWIWEINENIICTYCSPAVKNILGYEPEELIGNSPFIIMPKEEAKRLNKIFTGLGERKISFNRLESINIHKNGSKVIIESSGSPIFDNEGKFLGYRGINRDITERKLTQQNIYNAVITAEEKERSRVAKELHDGVSPILSTTKLYAQTLNDFKDQKDREIIMKKIGDNINDAIQSISEISANLSPHILQNFGLTTAVRSFTDKIKETKKIKFTIESDFDGHLSENIEFTLYRVCIELINNTIKHALANEVFINFEKKNDIVLTYKDNGRGFDYKKEIQKKKGMGLYNLTNRIESLNGEITFSKEKNKGIIITVKIPLNK